MDVCLEGFRIGVLEVLELRGPGKRADDVDVDAIRAPFVGGDARTGSSLVVNAIADAMACADEVARELGL